ncbi:MAG: glycosyltransferase family 4 protein [Bacteroidota bacterium]
MKILVLCNKSPYPPKEGGAIAMNALVEGLARAGNQLRVVAVSSDKFPVKAEDIPSDYCQKTKLEIVHLDLSIKPVDAFMNLFSKKSYHVQRFTSTAFAQKLTRILKEDNFDIIQLETLYMCPYIPLIRRNSKAKIVLRTHNIEHMIWEEIARDSRNPIKRWYLSYLARKLKTFEIDALHDADGIAAITDPDADYIRSQASEVPVETIHFGIFPEEYKNDFKPQSLPRDIFHIGSMNWLPNEEGIRWFLKDVMPYVHHLHDDLKLYLAGRMMPDWLLNYGRNNVVIVGEVENAVEFMTQHGIMIVPLFSGSGVRIKIVEAMLAGRAVISTSKGAQGLSCRDGENIMIADTRDDFVSAISKCLADPAFAVRLGENARKYILAEHNNLIVIEKLMAFYAKLLEEREA